MKEVRERMFRPDPVKAEQDEAARNESRKLIERCGDCDPSVKASIRDYDPKAEAVE
jgi:hypothetical protein